MGREQKTLRRIARENWVERRTLDFPKWESVMAKLDNRLKKEAAAMKKGRKEESK